MPYTERVKALGVQGYSIVNHMLLPKAFGRSTEEEDWHLREHVQLWDVSCLAPSRNPRSGRGQTGAVDDTPRLAQRQNRPVPLRPAD